jgi:nucleoside-diphosphate-sugar epimerase
MKALVIGGTRNLGPSIVSSLLGRGFEVTAFHRGQTNVPLPPEVQKLYGDRSDESRLLAAIGSRSFDVVVDTTLYTGEDARAAGRIFESRVGQYIMLSTGQVYLVRRNLPRPFEEADYAGPTIPAPAGGEELEEWRYGMHKRAAEDELTLAHQEGKFSVTVLRLPMVNSERDHFHRIEGYLVRLRDGGPILIPDGPHLKVRHVYGADVVRAITEITSARLGFGGAYNLSQDEEISIEEFLKMLAASAGTELRIVRIPRSRLESEHLTPACSPFSGEWMSALSNRRSKQELGVTYTPLAEYLPRLVEHFHSLDRLPPGYEQRGRELRIAGEYTL